MKEAIIIARCGKDILEAERFFRAMLGHGLSFFALALQVDQVD